MEIFFRRPRAACSIGVALLLLVALLALVVPDRPFEVDRSWASAMAAIPSPALRRLALVFNDLGTGIGRALVLAAVALALALRRRWPALVAFAATETATPLASGLLKAAVGRPRPADATLHVAGSSFPSGHAAYAGATAVAVVLLFTRPGRRSLWWVLAVLVIAGMSWSRTYLQVHWLSDVVAGSLLGIGVSLVCFAAMQMVGGATAESRQSAQMSAVSAPTSRIRSVELSRTDSV